jgi:hypothetical protein
LKRLNWVERVYSIDRNIVQKLEILIENRDFEPTKLLRPMFDAIWNACGYSQSFNYTQDGEWKPFKFTSK